MSDANSRPIMTANASEGAPFLIGGVPAIIVSQMPDVMPGSTPVAFGYCAVVGVCLVWWLFNRYGATAPQTWAGAMVYALCCELYIFLFTFALTSITANLVGKLSRCDLTDTDIEQLYDSRHMVATRLDRLIAIGLVVERPAGLQLTRKGARMARTLSRLRGFFRHPKPTYDFPTKC